MKGETVVPIGRAKEKKPSPALEAYREELRKRAEELDSPTQKTEDVIAAMRRCGVPGRHLAAVAKPLKSSQALKLAAEFLGNRVDLTSLLALLGAPGKGKSIAAAWVVREFLRKRGWNNGATGSAQSPAMWVDAGRLSGVSSYDKVDGQWLDELETTPLLVLDDIGDESASTGKDIVARLVSGRHAKLRRTVLTSNLTRTAMGARYGQAITDRLRDSAVVAELGGESMRGKAAP